MKTKLLYVSFMCLFLVGCDKSVDPVPASMNQFNIKVNSPAPSITEYEVLISQQDGKLLLDTLLSSSVPVHTLQVKSEQQKINITTVTKYTDIDPAYFVVNSFIQVDPNNWQISDAFENFDLEKTYSSSTKSRSVIRYTLPVDNTVSEPYNGKYFAATNNYGFSSIQSSGVLSVNYDRTMPSSMTYLLLPELGKYFFKEVSSGDVIVDQAEAGNVVKHNFILPQSFTFHSVNLFAYQQADSYTDPLELYNTGSIRSNYPNFDKPSHHLMYPSQIFKEYELRVGLVDENQNLYLFYNIVKDIPTDLNSVTKPNYSIVNKTFKNFSIEFPKEKPTYYSLILTSERSKLYSTWLVQLPADITSFNAEEFLYNLSPKLLKNEDLSTFSPNRISLTSAAGYNYQDFFTYVFSPEKLKERKLKQYVRVRASL
ncbi:hypothetical protein [Pontibacter pudoricolor]|uniref:hypothetical protein n=1 Tax=Pontibacter pudoricolor TaxID=2694930 RepID=UPI001390A518|nr:hypothetical protein [Pontibacter pudoricolor]